MTAEPFRLEVVPIALVETPSRRIDRQPTRIPGC